MNGRYMASNWDVAEILERRERIVGKDELKMIFVGDLGVTELTD